MWFSCLPRRWFCVPAVVEIRSSTRHQRRALRCNPRNCLPASDWLGVLPHQNNTGSAIATAGCGQGGTERGARAARPG